MIKPIEATSLKITWTNDDPVPDLNMLSFVLSAVKRNVLGICCSSIWELLILTLVCNHCIPSSYFRRISSRNCMRNVSAGSNILTNGHNLSLHTHFQSYMQVIAYKKKLSLSFANPGRVVASINWLNWLCFELTTGHRLASVYIRPSGMGLISIYRWATLHGITF